MPNEPTGCFNYCEQIYYKSNDDEFTTVLLHTGDDYKVKWLFYATVHTLMMGQWGPKDVAVDYNIMILTKCMHLLVYIVVIESKCTEWKIKY